MTDTTAPKPSSLPIPSKNVSPYRNSTRYANTPPPMNNSDAATTKPPAQRRSSRYKPGATNAHAWYRIQGAERNAAATSGSPIQMILNPSKGSTT